MFEGLSKEVKKKRCERCEKYLLLANRDKFYLIHHLIDLTMNFT